MERTTDMTAAAMASLEPLPLRARIIVDGALSGMQRARQKGSSVEFEQHKEYSPGDEIKHLDWKAYAKADRYFVKQFEQESELSCLLVVDSSASMSYRGSGPSKLEYAGSLAAALAHLLIRQRDRVGLLAFGDDTKEVYVPPRARPRHLHDIHQVLGRLIADGGRGAAKAEPWLKRALELCGRKRMMVVILSDLFDSGDALGRLVQLRARGHDVVLFQVLDRDELELPFDGLTIFEAMESDDVVTTHPTSIRQLYLERLSAFLGDTQKRCLESGIERYQVATDDAFEVTLRRFLERRLRGGRR